MTDRDVMFANEVFKTARVSSDADRKVTPSVPIFAETALSEAMLARSSHCKCDVTFA